MKNRRISFRTGGLTLSLFAVAAVAEPIALLPPGGKPGDRFADSVALSGGLAVVGTPLNDTRGLDAGAAYVFVRDCADWELAQELLPDDPEPGDRFGASVAIQDDLIVVGAEGVGGGQGAAYAFRRSGTTWTQEAKLLPDEATNGLFGHAVAIDQGIAVSAREDDDQGTDAGAVYVFQFDEGWSLQHKISPTDGEPFDLFGTSLTLRGNCLVVGSPFARGVSSIPGAAYVYEWQTEQWVFQQRLLASDGADGDGFGTSTAVSMDTILVGAPLDNAPGSLTDAGSVYVFRQVAGLWTEDNKLLAPVPRSFDHFGQSVGVDADVLVVGAPREADDALGGSGHIFVQATEGDWLLDSSISSGSSGVEFGWSAGVFGNHVAFGTPLEQAGAAYVAYVGPVSSTDFNTDGDTDLTDFVTLHDCASSPGGGLRSGCTVADLDADQDVDLADLAVFLNAAACAP